MSFRGIILTQPLIALIVITTLMITVCDSLPKYCQCIESKGNSFSAFAEYFIRDEKMTEFWLYQNKHKCQMFVKNKTEIVIDTSGQIIPLTEDYRLWLGFYFNGREYECRTYAWNPSEYEMECRKGNERFLHKISIDKHEYSNALLFLKETEAKPRLPVVLLFQSESDGKWSRIEKSVNIEVHTYSALFFTVSRDSTTESDVLSVLLKDIGSNVYINAVINAFDAKHNTKGFFIFVTNNGIPMYCYKSHIHDRNDSCKIENMKQFMRECYQTNERPMNMTTISSQTSETNTEKPDSVLFNVFLIAIIVIIIASIICLIPYFILFFKNIKKIENSKTSKNSPKMNSKGFNFDSNLSTLSTELNPNPVKNQNSSQINNNSSVN